MKAVKFDNEKPRMDLIPPKANYGRAMALTYGAKKYEDFNYKNDNGLDHGRILASCLRHLNAYNDGEEFDKESGLKHIWHAGACIDMLIDLIDSGIGRDSRFNRK